MAEYKQVVNEARARRKQKEKENKMLLKRNGCDEMRLQQGLLMGTSLGDVRIGEVNHSSNTVMHAIVIPVDTVQTQSIETAEGTKASLLYCGNGV